MARRRRKSSPLSLFSFQDIITSVTAVIILLTLILTLELITRKPVSAAEQLDGSVAELQSALEKAEAERDQIESRLQQVAASTIEQASSTPESLQRDLEQTQQQVVRLREELDPLRARQAAAKRLEDAALARSLDRDIARKELEELKAQAEHTETERDELSKTDQLIFNRPSGTSKRPWLVDVSAKSIVILPFNPDEERVEFHDQFLSSCTDQVIAWAREKCSATGDYFVLLVRPSGIEAATKLRDSLSLRGFEIGRDAIGATQKVTVGRAKPKKT